MSAARILIVEDEIIIAQTLAQRLHKLGYTVTGIVRSGEEAVRHADKSKSDLILMDIHLQGKMDGIAAAVAIRAQHNIPIIYLTGHADEATLARAKETSPFGYVLKPFQIRELHTTIEMALYKHAAEVEIRRLNADLERRIVERTAQLETARVELEHRLANEELVAAISANLLRLPPDQVTAGLAQALQSLGEFTGADYTYTHVFSEQGTIVATQHWVATNGSLTSATESIALSLFPWSITQLERGEVIHLPSVSEVPPEAAPEKNLLLQQGIQSVVVVPLIREGQLVGTLGLASQRSAHVWPEENIQLLRLSADLFASAIQQAQLFDAVARGKRAWETTFDTIADGISIHDPEFRILRANRTLARWFDTTPQALIGQPCYEVIHGQSEPPDFCLHRQTLESGQPAQVEWHDDLHGRTYLASFYPLQNDQEPGGNVHILRDITEQKRAEEALAQRNRNLALFSEIAVASSQTLDLERQLNMILTKVREQMALDGGWICLLAADDTHPPLNAYCGIPTEMLANLETLDPFAGLSGEVVRTGKPIQVDSKRYKHLAPAGGAVPASDALLAAVPIEFESRVTGVLGVFRTNAQWLEDIEVQLLATIGRNIGVTIENARLYTAEREQHRRAEESRAQLVESAKLAATGRLAASLAHEINNPLQSLHNSLQLLLSFALEPSTQQEYLELAAEEVERLMGITARILQFSRRPPAEMRPTQLPEVIDQVLALADKYLQHSEIVLERDLPDDLPAVLGNAQELGQVLLNLVLNAVEAMPDGGRLRVAGRQAADGRVAFSISDTGHGVPAEQQKRIFEPFFSTREDGTGLGLSVAYGIVERHGGEITVESRVDEGATFTVWLPALSEEQDHGP